MESDRHPAMLAARLIVKASTLVLKTKDTTACKVTKRRKARDLMATSDVWELAPMDVAK
jgi:hypothetical protein